MDKGRVKVLLPDEVKVLQDIQGRALDRQHNIDGCNEYKTWEERKKKQWWQAMVTVCKHCGSKDTKCLLGTAGGGAGGRYWCNACKKEFYWYLCDDIK